MDCFDRLPLACIVNNKYFCVHGGISPDTMTIKSINWINRAVEVPAEGAHCDLIWSDPIPNQQGTLSNPLGSTIKTKLMFNHMRCCSIFYGAVLSH